MIKIGDKVRFLNDVGGGIVSGFVDKNTCLVQDEDGFDIPTLIKDVVAVSTDDYNISKVAKAAIQQNTPSTAGATHTSVKAALAHDDDQDEERETDLAEASITYRPQPQQRRGAEQLNLYLGFVPQGDVADVATRFEAYLINDCNYHLRYLILSSEDTAATIRFEGEITPNTKTLLDTFSRNELAAWEKLIVQTLAYKPQQSFLPKPPMAVGLRPDCTRFYKPVCFAKTPFFTTPALLIDIVRDDRPARTLFVNAEELNATITENQGHSTQATAEPGKEARQALKEKLRHEQKPAQAAPQRDPKAPLEVDLHASELLDTMVGLSAKDILDYQLKVFHEAMQQALPHKGKRLVFIHGKGNGVLRNAIVVALRTRYKQCRFQDASFREYGFGATLVTIG